MLDRIIANISDRNCQIIHLDLTEYKNELNVPALKRLRKALESNNSVRKIIWPKDINALTLQIDADLQKKFKTHIPGSVAINQYKNTPFFHKIIERNADIYSNNTAVVNVDGKPFNYTQLNEQANQLAYYLSRILNLPKGSVLGIFLNRSINYIVSIIACMKVGIIFVPIDTDSKKVSNDRLEYYLIESRAKYVLTEHEQVNRLNKLSTKPHLLNVPEILSDEKIINNSATKSNPPIQIQPTDISYIYFSSGSTGDPKGIPIEYGGLLNRIVAHIDVLALTQKDNGAQYATVAFDASLMEITMMLSVGGCLTIVPNEYRLDVRKTGNFYKDAKISVAIFVPSSLAVLNPKDFRHLRVVLSTGEPVSPTTIKRWREEGYSSGLRKFINGYGDTEGTIAWTLGECIDDVHIGESILGCHLYLLKKIKKEEIAKFQKHTDISRSVIEQKISENKIRYWLVCQNTNEQGEIWLAGNGLTPGYLNQELNKKAFVNHPVFSRLYRTYNIAKYDIKGQCQIVDRKGRRLKIHGQFVEPKEIDNAIEKNNIQKVAKVFVSTRTYVLPDNPEYKRHHLIAYVEPRNGQKIDIIELFKSLRNLPRYMVPARWVVMDKLPTNNSGKIDRKKLSSDVSPFVMARFNKLTPPRDGMSGYEEQIHDIWCRLLGLEKNDISIHDDFFYLGGDSLLFMQMIDILKEEFSNKGLTQLPTVSASTLAHNPTIAAISRFIRLDEQKFDFIDYSLKRENGDKSPLILVPPITGELDGAYSKFIEKIPLDRPVIGLKYPGYQNILNMYESVEEHARDCSDAIISFRNKHNISGPVLLFGYSSGGIIVYAIAKILIAKNYKVYAFIGDSIAPDFYRKADQKLIKNINDSLLHRFINYFGVDPKKLAEGSRTVDESNYEYMSNELNRLLPQLKLQQQKFKLDFVKKVKLAEINYNQDPVEDMLNDSKIILLSADKTIESAGGDDKLYWSNCVNAVVNYEADHDNILEKITSDRLFHELLEEADNKIIYTWNIPSLVPGYIPRVELTSEIKAFFSGKGFAKSVICVLSGQSGCGKTMLATNIINASTQYLQRLYFNASSAHQLKRELLDFAKKQNISNVTHKNIFHHIELWLKEHPGGFLVLDNCNKEKLLKFIPSSGWHVLMTTTDLTNLKYHSIPVNGMKENEANKLLATECTDMAVNNRLAHMVNYQPLYLRLVNTYLRSYQYNASIKAQDLIRHFKSNNLSPEKLKFEISKIAFERFQAINYPAMQLLHELSYFNGSKISHLLVKLLITSGDAIKENNQFLSITNFLKENDLIHEMSNESFYIHPGLQELLKKEFETKNIKSSDAILLKTKENNNSSPSKTQELNNSHLMSICQKLISLYPFEKTERCYYEFCQQLKPHIKVLLEFAKSDNLYQVKMLRMLADSYQANGNYFKQVSCIKKAKDLVESEKYQKMKHDYEANIQKALVYIDFVKSRLSIAEQFRYLDLLLQAKNIFEVYFNDLSRSTEIAKIEVELNYIFTQMGESPRDKSIGYIDHLLHILPWESFERASVLKRVFSIFPMNKQDKVLQAACTIYENNDAAHPDLSLIYKQLYIMQKSKGVAQTQFLEKALDITIEVSEFYHINFDTFSLFTLLINDYYAQYASKNLQDIGSKIDKADYYVKFFKYLIKKLQNNLMQFTKDSSMRPLLPKVLCQEEKFKNNIKFNDRESVKNNTYNKIFLEVIKDIQQYCLNILGKPPCEFVIIVLGSFSYGLAIKGSVNGSIKGSDFEYCVIISPGHNRIQRQFIDHYFQCFLPLFETFFKVVFANTGCHIDRGVSPHVKYDKTQIKYNIKGFYGAPDDILDKHCKLTSNKSNKEGASKVSLYQLLNPLYLMGNKDLYQNFLNNLYLRLKTYNNHHVPFYRSYANEQFELHIKEYSDAYKAYYEHLKSTDSSLALDEKQAYLTQIKKLVAHPLVFMVFDIALYANILFKNRKMYSSIFELISVLQDRLILIKQHSDALEKALCDVAIIRNNINEDTYKGESFVNDNKKLLSICDEILSVFAKNREGFINFKLSDEESDEQHEEEFGEESNSFSLIGSTLQPDSHHETSSIKSKSNNADTLDDITDFPPLSIYRHGAYIAGNNQRQTAATPLSTPKKNVNASLDQSTDSTPDFSPGIIKKSGIEELINDEDEYYSSDEDSSQDGGVDELWDDDDLNDKWDIDEDTLYLKIKDHVKYQDKSVIVAKQQYKGFKSKFKGSIPAKKLLAELEGMKLDVNNKKTSLKSKNYQKEKVKYFKKTKVSDDNLRIRVGRNRVKNVSANKYNPHKSICIFDDAPNDVEDIIFSNVKSNGLPKKSQELMSSDRCKSGDDENLNSIRFLFCDIPIIENKGFPSSKIMSDTVNNKSLKPSGFKLSRNFSEASLSSPSKFSDNKKQALKNLIEYFHNRGMINLDFRGINDDILYDILDYLKYYSTPVNKLLLKGGCLTVTIRDKLLNLIEKSLIVELTLQYNYINEKDYYKIDSALKHNVYKVKLIKAVMYILDNMKESETVLDLSQVDMNDAAGEFLAEKLLHEKQKYQHITTIRFGHNSMWNRGVQALLDMQKENKNILAIHWHNYSLASTKLHQEFVNIMKQRRQLDDSNSKKPVKNETPKITKLVRLNKKSEQADLIAIPLPLRQKPFSFRPTKNSNTNIIVKPDAQVNSKKSTNMFNKTEELAKQEQGDSINSSRISTNDMPVLITPISTQKTIRPSFLFQKSSENGVTVTPITENKDQCSIIKPSFNHNLLVSPPSIDTSMIRRINDPTNSELHFFRSPPFAMLRRMAEANPNYLELLFKKNTTALRDNISPYFYIDDDEDTPTYHRMRTAHLGRSFWRSHNLKISIYNTVILWDEFFFNLNHYIINCKILNLSNLSLEDEDIYSIADNLRVNTTLLYLRLKISNLNMHGIEYLSNALFSNSNLLAIRFETYSFDMRYDETFFNKPALNDIKVSLYLNNYIRWCSIEQRLSQVFDNYSTEKDIDLSNVMLCDDGAKLLAQYLAKISCRIPKLNLENNYITVSGWECICYALFDYSTQQWKCSNLIFEQGNFDIDSLKRVFNDNKLSNPYVFSSFSGYRYSTAISHFFGYSDAFGQRDFNWDCSSDTLVLMPKNEVFPNKIIEYVTTSDYGASLWSTWFIEEWPILFNNKLLVESFFETRRNHKGIISAYNLESISTTVDQDAQRFNRRIYQKNMRATFFYNTSGRKSEHQRRQAPTKPNMRIGK